MSERIDEVMDAAEGRSDQEIEKGRSRVEIENRGFGPSGARSEKVHKGRDIFQDEG